VHAVGAGGESNVGAIVDQERRAGFRADRAQRPRQREQVLRGPPRLAKLHADRAARQHGEGRFD